jgi:rhodanese-related sulfurtransferase
VPAEPSWAPLAWTFAGLWEIQPEALEDLPEPVQVVDVRTPEEYSGPLGHIRGALLLPMDELASRIGELDAARPVVTVCRSGARSAQAATLLGKDGFTRVANLAGGMLRWRARGHAVVGGAV